MSVYPEIELRCDGVPSDRYGCNDVIHARTGRRARAEARKAGWKVSAAGGKDFCPEHRERSPDRG